MNLFVKDRTFYRTMLAVAVPISMQSMVSFCVNLIDTIMLGKFGEVALSATSLGTSFYMIYHVVCLGLSCGGAVLTAQFWGAGETEPIRKVTGLCFKMVFIACILFMLPSILIPETVLRIYTNEPAVIEAGAKYLRILACAFLFSGVTTAATQILRSVNIVKVTLTASLVACVVNIFGNWVFIFGNLGMPRLEVSGAALATALARVVECCVVLGYLLRDKIIGFRPRHLKGGDKDIFRRYLKSGLPVLISDLIMVVGANLITVIIGHLGSVYVAANSICNVVNNFAMSLFMGVSNASSILTGNTIGAGEYDRAYREGKTFLMIAFLMGCAGGVLLYLIRFLIIGIYDVTAETKDYAGIMITVMSCLLPFMLMEHSLTKGVLRGGGDTRFLIFADAAFAYLVSAPLGYLAAFVFGWPVGVIYACLKADMLCKTVLCLWRFISKRWVRDVTLRGSVDAAAK